MEISEDYAARILSVLQELGISPQQVTARGLPLCPEATSLVVAECVDDGREHQLQPKAAQAWLLLRDAARRDGVELYIVSAFRSVSRQADIIRRKLAAGQSLAAILTVSALPGYSEHHTGRAVDIGTPGSAALQTAFESTPAFHWLAKHAATFGFTLSYPRNNPLGYVYEPWHWLYQGKPSQPD